MVPKDASSAAVQINVTVNKDRTVATAEIVDQARLAADSAFRAEAEVALQSIRSPQCSPLALPPDKYEDWKSMTISFDPKEMLGQ
jgi:hypothetical protein